MNKIYLHIDKILAITSMFTLFYIVYGKHEWWLLIILGAINITALTIKMVKNRKETVSNKTMNYLILYALALFVVISLYFYEF